MVHRPCLTRNLKEVIVASIFFQLNQTRPQDSECLLQINEKGHHWQTVEPQQKQTQNPVSRWREYLRMYLFKNFLGVLH